MSEKQSPLEPLRPAAVTLASWDGDKLQKVSTVLHNQLELELSDGIKLTVELFERRPGHLTIRVANGGMVVRPAGANAVDIAGEKW